MKSSANTGETIVDGALYAGAQVIRLNDPRATGQVAARVRSSDDDSIGLIARWHDQVNYYYFSVNPQEQYANIVRVQDNVYTELAHVNFTTFATWGNTWRTLEFSHAGPHFVGSVDGVAVVTASDSAAPHDTGYYGLYTAFMNPVEVTWLEETMSFHIGMRDMP